MKKVKGGIINLILLSIFFILVMYVLWCKVFSKISKSTLIEGIRNYNKLSEGFTPGSTTYTITAINNTDNGSEYSNIVLTGDTIGSETGKSYTYTPIDEPMITFEVKSIGSIGTDGTITLEPNFTGSMAHLGFNVNDTVEYDETNDSFSVVSQQAPARVINPTTTSAFSWGDMLSSEEMQSDHTVTITTANVPDDTTLTLTLNGKDYTAQVTGNETVVTIPASDLLDLQSATEVKEYTVVLTLPEAPDVISDSFSVEKRKQFKRNIKNVISGTAREAGTKGINYFYEKGLLYNYGQFTMDKERDGTQLFPALDDNRFGKMNIPLEDSDTVRAGKVKINKEGGKQYSDYWKNSLNFLGTGSNEEGNPVDTDGYILGCVKKGLENNMDYRIYPF